MIRHRHRFPNVPRRRPARPAALRHGDVLTGVRLPEATHVPRGLR